MHVAIVGAGLAGPLLAQGLKQAGVEISLYERDAADQPSQGYRIHIALEGDLALRACLSPLLYDRVLSTSGKRGSGWRVLDSQLHVVKETLIPPSADERETGRHLTVDRLTLRQILLTGVNVHYGASFERYERLKDGRVRAFFANGQTADADLLVAADGTHSRVRAQLLPHAEVVETGQSEIFGKTLLTGKTRALMPPAALDGFCLIAGADGRFMPLAAYEFRSGGDDYAMWVIVAPTERMPPDLPHLDKTSLAKAAAELIADWHPNLGALVQLADPETVYPTTVRTAKPVPHWQTGPVTLMGDAIHAMVPQGTSAAVALWDAALLCRRITGRTGTLLDAVHAYEAEMLEHGFAEVARSLRATG